MAHVTVDFETKSACDLNKCGASVYAQHPSTDATFLGYSFNGGTPKLWSAGNFMTGVLPDPPPDDLFEFIESEDPFVVAHNCLFEKMIWTHIMEKRYGWPSRSEFRWMDTMAVCAMKAIPLKLVRAGQVLDLRIQKDTAGSRALHQIMKPQKMPKKKEHNLVPDEHCEEGFGWNNDPELYRITGEYCRTDVRTEDGLLDRVRTLSRVEQAVWELDQVINERGVRFDLDYVSACEDLIQQACVPLAEKFAEITGGLAATQRDKVLAWIRERLPPVYSGAIDENDNLEVLTAEEQLPNMVKDVVEEFMLRGDLPEDVRSAMELRSDLTSASIKKVDAMRRSTDKDGIAVGMLQYHAAGPGRWGGRLIQPQNFPRGVIGKYDIATLIATIMHRDAELLATMFGNSTVKILASSLRHGIIARPGRILCAGDFSSIEARIVLALAGQHDQTELMRQGLDIYNALASTIFGFEVDRKSDAHKLEGQMGKSGVLGCGFQMGAPRFKAQVKEQTGMEISLEMAEKVVKTYRKEFAPLVPKLWYGLQDAAIRTVWDRTPHEAFGVTYALHDAWLTCRLPSGRLLWYFNPQQVKKAVPWDENDIREGFTYQTTTSGKWVTKHAYGGLLTENVVQGLARDLMVNSMFKVEFELGYPHILTVHDEEITEPEEHRADKKAMEEVMCDAPPWARELGIPVQAECWIGERYRK
jgi:DNA polymerase